MAYTNLEIAFALLVLGAVITTATRSWRAAGWLSILIVGGATALAWIDGLSVLLHDGVLRGVGVPLPRFGSELAVSLDPLGAGFLLLITGVSFVATVYSLGYMSHYTRETPRRFYSMFLLFIAGMMGVVSVADWLFFWFSGS